MRTATILVLGVLLSCLPAALAPAAAPADAKALAGEILSAAAVPGGLCVQVGAGDGTVAAELAAGGRFLVHGLEPDAAKAETAVRHIRSRGLYGQAWVEQYTGDRLPYAENLVNLLVVSDPARINVPQGEIMRVLCPGGVACIRRVGGPGWTRIQKPRPAEMDDWGHPRHGPDGNAASRDTLVGPPRRIRWVAGPMHEVSNIVTAGGRFFYHGVIARDAFNGLPLWDRKLDPTPSRLGFPASAVKGSVLPVATADRLYVVSQGKLQALDAATGEPLKVYADAGTPLEILYTGGTLVACDAESVRAADAAGGKLLWSHEARQPADMVAGDGGVYFYEAADAARGPRAIVKLDLATGKPAWRRADYPWAAKARRLSYHRGLLVCEVSTLTNDRPGNGIHVLDARDGKQVWERLYEPGHAHYQQGRALQTDSRLWILSFVQQDNKAGFGQWEALDPATGSTVASHRAAGSNHCFPPVATPRFLLGSEMGFTDMATGQSDSNRITKGACGRDAGFIPANGLLYTAPKHCTCYPMIKSYSALAPAKSPPGPAAKTPEPADFAAERGPAFGQAARAAAGAPAAGGEWPSYRADLWRSASTAAAVPADLEVLWTADLGDWPQVALAADWKENPGVRGPVTPPVAAAGLVLVAQPDGHRVVALDAKTGQVRWDFTANGRVDTPPTVAGGLCLLGTRSGTVYALRAEDGKLAWRLRVAPEDERIVAFGQVESPWPAAGSVLVVGGTAYVAAGRHPLADGGIRVLALDPATGAVKWVKTITSLPIKSFYGGNALEFDCFDLLVGEARRPAAPAAGGPRPPGAAPPPPVHLPARPAALGAGPDCITMSRWQIDLASGQVGVSGESGFAWCRTGGAGVMVPRGVWTYGQRMDYLASGPRPGEPDTVGAKPRPLAAFRDGALFVSTEDRRSLFRRDFTPESIAAFDDRWYSRAMPKKGDPGDRNRTDRLVRSTTWTAEIFGAADRGQGIGAVVLAGDTVFVAGTRGRLLAYAAADGKKRAERDLPPLVWDGMAAAHGCLYVSTADGKVVCFGAR
ncbi:MAG: PQQ-binding-like beta-propeller repeat protein [Planctomycetes bacterium]|nr:PQQ-binding-like beta-propeller repeat protein [Planctomycetota bacterium]